MHFAPGDNVRIRSGGPDMAVTDVRADEETGEVTVWSAWSTSGEDHVGYFPEVALGRADAPAALIAAPRPGGPLPDDVVANPRAGGLMTVIHVDAGDRITVWSQWFTGDAYGSGSFPLGPDGRVVEYAAQDL